MDVSKRGMELVLSELCQSRSSSLSNLSELMRKKPDECGLAHFEKLFGTDQAQAEEIYSLGSAYIAAERIRGRR